MPYDVERALYQQRRAANGGGLGAGAGELALAFMGGTPQHQQNVETQGALIQDRLAQARQRQFDEVEKQRQRSVRHGIAARYRSDGNQNLGDFFDAYDNPEQIAAANEKLLQAAAMQKNLELADAPNVDYNHINARKIATAAGPTELVRSLGDGSYTTNAYRTDPNVELSEVGQAFVGEKKALAGEHNAQAARATAAIGSDKASNYEIVDTPLGKVRVNKMNPSDAQPVTMGGQPVQGKPANPRAFTEHEMAAGLSTPDAPGKIDPLRFRQFEAVKTQTPGADDSDVFARLRQQDAEDEAATNVGPPKDLAGDGGNVLTRLFGAAPAAQATAKPGRKIVRTGTANGKRVVQYDDGTIEEQ